MRVELVPYQDSWVAEFTTVGGVLRGVLDSTAVAIHHIGSTAVPGLPAKNVIDVQVSVTALDDVVPFADRLLSAGFVLKAELGHDHAPTDRPGTAADWIKRFMAGAPGRRRVHVHVREVGRLNRRYALLFRDYLRQHPSEADRYLAEKRRLAALHGFDSGPYSEAKDEIFDDVGRHAEAWADRCDWTIPETDA
jgi:GrpB-like predicted nucleotidyltransferase (UPF0157 family)